MRDTRHRRPLHQEQSCNPAFKAALLHARRGSSKILLRARSHVPTSLRGYSGFLPDLPDLDTRGNVLNNTTTGYHHLVRVGGVSFFPRLPRNRAKENTRGPTRGRREPIRSIGSSDHHGAICRVPTLVPNSPSRTEPNRTRP